MLRPAIGLLVLSAAAPAQLTDLQPGRNFPVAEAQFGLSYSENVDIGDADNDGDYDVIVANGGTIGLLPNRIFINLGGIQGGTAGGFSEETAARFAGVPNDSSRDIDFVDSDDDGDLDILVANRGTSINGGEPSRFYRNRGGAHGGPVGFFTEATDSSWGTLISVPLAQQVFGGNQGPFREHSCDCEFGDLDLDGDVDLFHSSYGPNIGGASLSRLFLNDAGGVFHELWPWINPGGDITTHAMDVDLADLDGDFDLDVLVSSLMSQSRIYRNNLDPASATWTAPAFTDVTQSALIATGASQASGNTYEGEFGDVDGDGDLDAWMSGYGSSQANADSLLRNDGNLTFTKLTTWLKADPVSDENEVDFLDFDGDGDLDAFLANESGTNSLYQGGLAQGLDPGTQGLFHRTGTSTGGSLASWPELPATGNGGTSMDGECADMDGDGDTDILVANDLNQQNRYLPNALGVPDTHAPTIHQITVQGDKSDGSDTPIRAQLRDNAAFYVIDMYPVDLLYTVDGGIENRLQMTSQGGQQFQATIPGAIDGLISYRVAGRDDAGNTFSSTPIAYTQNASGVVLIQSADDGTPGVHPFPFEQAPYLRIGGSLVGGSQVTVDLRDAGDFELAVLFFSLASSPLPFKGGLLHTVPVDGDVSLLTDAGGQVWFAATWPIGLPSGAQVWYQFALADDVNPTGAVLSNAVKTTLP